MDGEEPQPRMRQQIEIFVSSKSFSVVAFATCEEKILCAFSASSAAPQLFSYLKRRIKNHKVETENTEKSIAKVRYNKKIFTVMQGLLQDLKSPNVIVKVLGKDNLRKLPYARLGAAWNYIVEATLLHNDEIYSIGRSYFSIGSNVYHTVKKLPYS